MNLLNNRSSCTTASSVKSGVSEDSNHILLVTTVMVSLLENVQITNYQGMRNSQSKNLRRAETANVEKFGKDRDHNALYVAGYSGSGKSTMASGVARKNDKIIRLDFYAEPIRKDTKPLMDKEFNSFLEKKGIDYKKVANAGMPGSKYWNSGSYWKEVDKIRDAIEEYSKEQYDKGNRVIVEGVQIQGDWLAGEKNYYKGNP